MKIIYGSVKPDAGKVFWNGKEVHIANPSAARELGIAMVFQHFSLFDTLTVAENIALGLPRDTKLDELERRISNTAEQYGLELEPQRHVHTLSVGECQRVEIVRALLAKLSVGAPVVLQVERAGELRFIGFEISEPAPASP